MRCHWNSTFVLTRCACVFQCARLSWVTSAASVMFASTSAHSASTVAAHASLATMSSKVAAVSKGQDWVTVVV